MPYDGVMIHTVVMQLNETIRDAYVDRITQPARDEIHIALRAPGHRYRLVLSCNAQFPRILLSERNTAQNDHPPMFCMLLRKHLGSGRVVEVTQRGLDRVVFVRIRGHNELGDQTVWTLAAELMGRHSNLVLCDEKGMIVDAIKRVYPEKSRVRPVLPAMMYSLPPEEEKNDPLQMDAQGFLNVLNRLPEGDWERHLVRTFEGVSPQTASELLVRAGILQTGFGALSAKEKTALAEAMEDFFGRIRRGDLAPAVCADDRGTPKDVQPFSYLTTKHLNATRYATPCEAVEAFFEERTDTLRIAQKSADLTQLLKNRTERAQRKLGMQQNELLEAENSEQYRLYGELLSAYLYKVPKGADSVTVTDYTTEDQSQVSIPLRPELSPAQNVQTYFKRYNRARSAQRQLTEKIAQSEAEVEMLTQHAYNLKQCRSEEEIEQIRAEMVEDGILKQNARRKTAAKKSTEGMFDTYRTSTGFRVRVGRNNRQNDRLTRSADPEDLWMHVQKRPGSHLILTLNSAEADDLTLIEAARIAAAYSSASHEKRVNVDYTRKKYVNKPSGGALGFVTYTHQRTLNVEPATEAFLDERRETERNR